MGGFRIAARLADAAKSVGFRLDLWRMNAAEDAKAQSEPVSDKQIDQITTICGAYGWQHEREGFEQHPVFQEQEFIVWSPPIE